MTALNPVKTIGEQVAEGIRWHTGANRARRRGPRAQDARPGRAARGEVSAVALSARTVRRPAPARRHRHRLRAEAEAADRRRADHGARRRAAAQILELLRDLVDGEPHGPAADLARSRRGCRHGRPHHHPARRRGDGGRRHRATLSQQVHPYTRQLAQASMHVPARPRHRAAASAGAVAAGRQRVAHLSRPAAVAVQAGPSRSMRSTASPSRSDPASRPRWSAVRAAGSRRWRAWSWRSTGRHRAASVSSARR